MPSLVCSECSDSLPSDGRFMNCQECKKSFHLGPSCSGISDNTFISMGTGKRAQWECRECRGTKKRPRQSSTPSISSDALHGQIASINEKLESLASLKVDVNSLLGLPSKVDQLLGLKAAVDDLRSSVNEVQKSVSFLSEKYDDFVVRMSANDRELRETVTEVISMKEKLENQATEIELLKSEVNRQEQYSRLQNLEIHGIPVQPNENLTSCAAELAHQLKIKNFDTSSILAIHRLPARNDKVPTVIIRFASVAQKNEWMSHRGELRALNQSGSGPRLFFNENLTASNRELFWLTRRKGKEKNYRFVWTKDGTVFAKKDANSPLIRVLRVDDLSKLI